MSVWGIDPGINGALVHFNPNEGEIDIHDMPIMEVRGKKTVSPNLVYQILKQHNSPAYIERVHAMPGQGVTSMFNFGKGYGIILGVLAGLEYKITTVPPTEWQRKVAMPKGKDGSRERACQLAPNYSQAFARKRDNGRSDAYLIAYYGFSYADNV